MTVRQITFTVPGIPKAQKRHRTYTTDKQGRALPFPRKVDPSEEDKANFLLQARQDAPDSPWTGPISLHIVFLMPRSKSHYGSGRNRDVLKSSAPTHHTKRPDLDNLVKLVKDALASVFYRNDSQIVHLDAVKGYTQTTPVTAVKLTEYNPGAGMEFNSKSPG